MRWLRSTLLAAAALAVAACSGDPEEPHGSPVLLEIDWGSTSGRIVVYAAGADAATTASVPAAGIEIDFVFDRRLDGTRVEDIVGNTAVPKANPPITVSWPGMSSADAGAGADGGVAGESSFSDEVFYSSTPLYSGPTAYVYLRPRLPGFPAATPVTFTLDPNGLTSAYGEPMTGPTSITVMVAPMTTLLDGSSSADALPSYASSFAFPVRFSNRLPASTLLAPFAHARAGDLELPIALARDPQDATRLYVSPAACLGGWPAGAVVAVSFDPGLPDAFGVPTTVTLPGGAFMVAGSAGDAAAAAPADGGCSVATDAGAGD